MNSQYPMRHLSLYSLIPHFSIHITTCLHLPITIATFLHITIATCFQVTIATCRVIHISVEKISANQMVDEDPNDTKHNQTVSSTMMDLTGTNDVETEILEPTDNDETLIPTPLIVLTCVLLFVSISLAGAIFVFCKKKNSVFVLQKCEEETSINMEMDELSEDSDTEIDEDFEDRLNLNLKPTNLYDAKAVKSATCPDFHNIDDQNLGLIATQNTGQNKADKLHKNTNSSRNRQFDGSFQIFQPKKDVTSLFCTSMTRSKTTNLTDVKFTNDGYQKLTTTLQDESETSKGSTRSSKGSERSITDKQCSCSYKHHKRRYSLNDDKSDNSDSTESNKLLPNCPNSDGDIKRNCACVNVVTCDISVTTDTSALSKIANKTRNLNDKCDIKDESNVNNDMASNPITDFTHSAKQKRTHKTDKNNDDDRAMKKNKKQEYTLLKNENDNTVCTHKL